MPLMNLLWWQAGERSVMSKRGGANKRGLGDDKGDEDSKKKGEAGEAGACVGLKGYRTCSIWLPWPFRLGTVCLTDLAGPNYAEEGRHGKRPLRSASASSSSASSPSVTSGK
jgi:hypothetical protein